MDARILRRKWLVKSVKLGLGSSASVTKLIRRSRISRSTYYRAIKDYKLNGRKIRSHAGTERLAAIKVVIAAASGNPWTVSMVQEYMSSRGYTVGRRKAWQLLTKWTREWQASGLGSFAESKTSRTVICFINQLRKYRRDGRIDQNWNSDNSETLNFMGELIDQQAFRGRRRSESEENKYRSSGGRVNKKPRSTHDWD